MASHEPIARGSLALDPERRIASWKGRAVPMRAEEFAILWALAESPGRIFRRADLIDLAPSGSADDAAYVTHIARIRQRLLAVDGTFCAIETICGVGYRFNP